MKTHTIKFDKSMKKVVISGIFLLTLTGYVDLRNTRCECPVTTIPAPLRDIEPAKPPAFDVPKFHPYSPAQADRIESEQ